MSLRFEGIGLHSGESCSVTLHPGGDEGLVFCTAAGRIPVSDASVRPAELCTALSAGPASVLTVEHLLSALTALGHWSAELEVTGPEIPILDGSARPFAEALPAPAAEPAALAVLEGFSLQQGAASVRVEPAPPGQLLIDYAIAFAVPSIGAQRLHYRHAPQAYLAEIAPARTFTLLSAVEEARRRGLIRGGSLDCALVFDEGGPVNPPVRFPDEPVRHKVLDLLGDLALLGRPLHARLAVERGGHALHAALVRELLRRQAASEGVELVPPRA